jgi:hypothetical protein
MSTQDVLNHIFGRAESVPNILREIQRQCIDGRMSAIDFLLDVCNSSKQLISTLKHDFFHKLISSHLLDILFHILSEDGRKKGTVIALEDPKAKAQLLALKEKAAELLTNCLQILPSMRAKTEGP